MKFKFSTLSVLLAFALAILGAPASRAQMVLGNLAGGPGGVIAGANGFAALNTNYYAAYLTGTAYSLTASYAAVAGGTTSPSVTLGAPGTYLISGNVITEYVGATFAANQSESFEFYRTNNTAGAVSTVAATNELRIATTLTDSAGTVPVWSVLYTTATTGDVITIYGTVSTLPSAGNVNVTGAAIVAIRLY